MSKMLLFAAAMVVWANAETAYNFNDYNDISNPGDRSNTTMFNRKAVGGDLKCLAAVAEEFSHQFGVGMYDYDARKHMGYYWNPGIQEFGQSHLSSEVQAAYLWGHKYFNGLAGAFGAQSGAMVVALQDTDDAFVEPTWNLTAVPIGSANYESLPLLAGSLDDGSYEGWGTDMDWYYDSVQQAVSAGHAFVVTNAVKYIMDNNTTANLGIVVRSTSGEGQLCIPAEENASTGVAFGLVLTIITSGTAAEAKAGARASLTLAQNTPNPFAAGTAITFNVPGSRNVALSVYGVDGRLVNALAAGTMSGSHTVAWNGSDNRGVRVKSGVYVCRLTAGDQTLTRRMIILK